MATQKVIDTVCGFPEDLLISQTPMVCRLLLKSTSSISHKHQSVKKWMNSLTKLLENSIHYTEKHIADEEEESFLSFDNESNKNKKKNKKNKNNEKSTMNINAIWSSLCLLSSSYRIITSGYPEWDKHFNIILDLLSNSTIFYNPILRTRCFETLCEIMEYSRCIQQNNAYHLSLQLSSKLIQFIQNIIIQIVIHKNSSFNNGGRLLETVLMILYRLLSNGKYLSGKINISIINKACFHCLTSNDYKIRNTAIGILILLCNNDKKYNQLIDKTVHTLHYLLRDLFPSNIILSYNNNNNNNYNVNSHGIDKTKCIDDILEIIPNSIDIDRFNRIGLFKNLMNGLMYLLNHLLRRKNNKSMKCVNTSSTSSVKTENKNINNKDSNIKIVSASCSMNSFQINVPIKSLFILIMDITSISIHESIKYSNLIEFSALLNELYQNGLWILINIMATLQKSILPYSSIITHIILSIIKETKQLSSLIDYEIRCSVYECISHIVCILGPSIYDILYNDLRIHLLNDLKSAQKLLMTSPPNPANINQKNKEQLITSIHAKNYKPYFNGDDNTNILYESPLKKQKLNDNVSNNNNNNNNIYRKNEEKGLYLQREYDIKLSFYGSVLKCISSFFNQCSIYMSFDEKSEIELILSSSILTCYSDGGHILINLCLIDLLNEFIETMVSVLMAPKMYKKPYLSLTSKLLSSSFGIGTILSNLKLIKNSQNGLKYIESVINPRSIPVYNKPLILIKNTKNSLNIDGNQGSLRNINKWNNKMKMQIINEMNKNNKINQDNQSNHDQDDDEDDDDENDEDDDVEIDDGNNNKLNEFNTKTSMAQKLLNRKRTFSELQQEDVENDGNDIMLNGITNNFVDDDTENDDDDDDDENEDDDSNKDDDNEDMSDDGNNFNVEIKSMMKHYGDNNNNNNNNNDIHVDDDNVEPLWSY